MEKHVIEKSSGTGGATSRSAPQTLSELRKAGLIRYRESVKRQTLCIETYPTSKLTPEEMCLSLHRIGKLKHKYIAKSTFAFQHYSGTWDTYFEHSRVCPCQNRPTFNR